MSNSNQEIIEARLATYIDGELDAQERLEIEAHLQQNPQYRKLVDELRRGREMLRGLPRESAPPELAEAFTSQLERSVLLSSEPDQPEPRMRVGAWPRLFATAAILFLTFGLATIVYFVLPGRTARFVATTPVPRTPATTSPSDMADIDQPPDADARKDLQAAGNADKSNGAALRAGSPKNDELAMGGGKGKGAVGGSTPLSRTNPGRLAGSDASLRARLADRELEQLASNVSQDPHVQELLAHHPSSEVHLKDETEKRETTPVVMVVRANDPRQTATVLNEFFLDNSIDAEAAPAVVEAALNRSISQQREQEEKSTRADRDPQESRLDERKKAGETVASTIPSPTPAPLQPETPVPSPHAENTTSDALAKPHAAAPGAAAKPTTAAPVASAKADEPAAPAATPVPAPAPHEASLGDNAKHDSPEEAGKKEAALGVASPGSIETIYIARRLSRAQAQLLNDCLARNGEVRQASADSRSTAKRSMQQRQFGAAGLPPDMLGRKSQTQPSAVDALAEHDHKIGPPSAPAAPAQVQSNVPAAADHPRDELATKGADTQPSPATMIQKGDRLQLLLGVDKEGKEQSETVTVKDDGTINLPGAEFAKDKPLAVAGKSILEAEKEIQSMAGEGTAPAPATHPVKIVRLVEGLADDAAVPRPATSPTVNLVLEQIKEAQRRRAALTAAPPATAPASDSEGAIDVVIVVQNYPAASKQAAESANTALPTAAPAAVPSSRPSVEVPATPAPASEPAK